MITNSITAGDLYRKNRPGQPGYDPRWTAQELEPGRFKWTWKAATIDFVDNMFVAQVGDEIWRAASLDAAEWWCEVVMGTEAYVSAAARLADVAEMVCIPVEWLARESAVAVVVA